jgi:hypothetical protein
MRKNIFFSNEERMSKSRMMGAGNACSSLYKCDANLKTGGGSKKQGITSRVGLNQWSNREVQVQSNGAGRFKLFWVNQLGGIGAGHSMFNGGGVQKPADSPPVEVHQLVNKTIPFNGELTGTHPYIPFSGTDYSAFIFSASPTMTLPVLGEQQPEGQYYYTPAINALSVFNVILNLTKDDGVHKFAVGKTNPKTDNQTVDIRGKFDYGAGLPFFC